MKTIQEHFREADTEELINSYIFQHPLSFDPSDELNPNTTIAEIYKRYEDKLRNFIERIRTVECVPDPNDEEWVFFVHHTIEHDGDDIAVVLAKQEDIFKDDESLIPYGYDFSPIAETAGIPVADTYLTQRNIHAVLLDYMFETSFFGYEQEELPAAIQRLDEALEHSKAHPEDLHPIDELWEKIGYEPEKHDPDERHAWKECLHAESKYCRIATDIERRKVAECLRKNA